MNISCTSPSCVQNTNKSAGRFRSLPLFVVLAIVAAAFVALPATASAFNVANFNYSNSSLQAGGHPETTVSFTRQGSESEDLKDVQLDLPTGVFANPESATPKCTSAQFNADTCPASSKVGEVETGVKAMSLLDLTVHGTINIITPRSDEVATLGLTLRPEKLCILFVFCAQPQKMFLKTGVKIKSYEDSGLRTYTPGAPASTTVGIPLVFFTPTIQGDITVNSMKLSFQSRAGSATTTESCSGWGWWRSCKTTVHPPAGPYFWTQTGSCLPAVAAVKLVSYQNQTSSATSTFTPTGCGNVPFNPSTAFSVANNDSFAPTPVSYTLNVPDADAPIQNALPKIVDVDFPIGSGLNLDALSGVDLCTEAQLKTSSCPDSSIIGTADAFSKYLPGPNASTPGLQGNVFAMGIGNQVPIGVELNGPRQSIVIMRGTMGTRGDANTGDGRVYTTFDKIPQLPFRSFTLNIDKPVYKNPPTCGNHTVTAAITGFNGTPATNGNGTVVTRTTQYAVDNCMTAPNTTITNGPPSTTPDTTPTFSFASDNAAAAFQCSVDGSAFAPCESPYTLEPLTDGQHTFAVRAVVGTVTDATPAENTFTVESGDFVVTPTITVSDYQAVGHPDVSASFDITGGQPKQIALKLPNGFAASLAAVENCSNANAAAGTCPAASKIGTTSLTVNTFNGAETGTGDIFLTEGPGADDAGGVAVNIQFSFGNLITQGGAYLVENGKNQYLDLRSIPLEVNGTSINATNLTVNLSGANKFLTNPSACTSSAWISTGTAWDGTESEVFNVPFQATGCNTVPFSPTINQTLTSPVAGTQTGVTADLSFGVDNSAAKIIRVGEPPTLAPNYAAFGQSADQCTSAAAPGPSSIFDPSFCPPQAKVGTMTINTPLLPFPLTGTVHLIEKSPIPWLGVKLDSPGIHVRLTGVTSTPKMDPNCDPQMEPTGYCVTQISVLFNNLPDVQMSNINMVLDGPARQGVQDMLPGQILKVAQPNDATCVDTTPAKTTFMPFSGTAPVVKQQPIAISGCQTP